MNVTLNGEAFRKDFTADKWEDFIKAICAELLKHNQSVAQVSVDGSRLPSFSLEELSKYDISLVKEIDIRAVDIYATIRAILGEILKIIPETEQYHTEVAELINKGKHQEAMKVLDLVLRYWQNLAQVVKTIGDVASAKGLKLPNTGKITAEFQQLREISQDIQGSIASQDYVNVADIVTHVLKPKMWVWKVMVEELNDFVSSES